MFPLMTFGTCYTLCIILIQLEKKNIIDPLGGYIFLGSGKETRIVDMSL